MPLKKSSVFNQNKKWFSILKEIHKKYIPFHPAVKMRKIIEKYKIVKKDAQYKIQGPRKLKNPVGAQ